MSDIARSIRVTGIFPPCEVPLTSYASLVKERLQPTYAFDGKENPHYEPHRNFLTSDGIPWFEVYSVLDDKENSAHIRSLEKKFAEKKHLLIIGNGGSITSAQMVYGAMKEDAHRTLTFVDSMEPRFIREIMATHPPDDTLIVPVSKSGNTVGVLELYLFFRTRGYRDAVYITTKGKGTLSAIVSSLEKENAHILTIPDPIGGRYSGRTAAAMFPLWMAFGEDAIKRIDAGAREAYRVYGVCAHPETNDALRYAGFWYEQEKNGIDTLFSPVYTHSLDGAATFLMQLQHESSCKEGRGQTLFFASAPESQHHTNVRIFGGKRNLGVVFFRVLHDDEDVISVPPALKAILAPSFSFIDGMDLRYALYTEYAGVKKTCDAQNIPNVTIELVDVSFETLGALMGFSHYACGVYPSVLRNVNPFDQPPVEMSKTLSIDLRKQRQ